MLEFIAYVIVTITLGYLFYQAFKPGGADNG